MVLCLVSMSLAHFGDRQGVTRPLHVMHSVISYSLYGDNVRYTEGAIANHRLMPIIYPGWKMRVYYDSTVPMDILRALDNAHLVNMTGSVIDPMMWRFLPAADPGVYAFGSRDIDARLSRREKAAVDEWLDSDYTFHVMRDHPSHGSFAMSGGMWGCKPVTPTCTAGALRAWGKGTYMHDMNFLGERVWPVAKRSVMQHDTFSCDKYGGGLPFPSIRIGDEHVGSVILAGGQAPRAGDVALLRQAVPKCRPATIGIGVLTCSCGKEHHENLLPKILLPSLVATTTWAERTRLHVTVGIDDDDKLFGNSAWRAQVAGMGIGITFMQVHKPEPHYLCFNDVMRAAFNGGYDYLARTNDDIQFTSKGWMRLAIDTLTGMNGLGVVGPTYKEGNTQILAGGDMVPRRHLDIFDTYYPVEFPNWWVDDWIMYVYSPKHIHKLEGWHVVHTQKHGQRYANGGPGHLLESLVRAGKKRIDAAERAM